MSATDLDYIIQSVKEKIAEQGPLEFFIHHNTIHHYENYDAFEAMKKAATDNNTRAFMPESYYLKQYHSDRIEKRNFLTILDDFLIAKNSIVPKEVLFRILTNAFIEMPPARYCYGNEITKIREKYTFKRPQFYNKALESQYGANIDFNTSALLYRFFSAYFDFGSAHWQLEDREKGLWDRFCYLHQRKKFLSNRFLRNLANLLKLLKDKNSLAIIDYLLVHLGVQPYYYSDYLFHLAFKFKGWSGFVKSVEARPHWLKGNPIVPDFTEFLAVILVSEVAAVNSFCAPPPQIPSFKEIPLHSKEFLEAYFEEYLKNKKLQKSLDSLLPELHDLNRQELWHRAYEDTFYSHFLTAYKNRSIEQKKQKILYQVICCLDDREESFRRYLEVDSHCETFGMPGHFGLNIEYKGFFDKHYRAFCPILVEPDYKIEERVKNKKNSLLKMLILWGEIQWLSALGSRTILPGFFQSFFSLLTNIIPFCLDIISPKLTYQIRQYSRKKFNESIETEILYQKEQQKNGISLENRIKIAEGLLKTIGLIKYFSPYVFFMGHGSSSLNNPHLAAYDCGACGGARAIPNARIIAALLNEPAIREGLKTRNIIIPEKTFFIAAYHNTCSDSIDFYDLERIPSTDSLRIVLTKIKAAGALNARERMRRFTLTPYNKKPSYYLKYAQARSVDLRQPRPECGHATNAVCIVGPRRLTRSLFMDRRAFLVSYDYTQDEAGDILDRITNTAVIVSSGINLEYYFSFIANEVYGCGTKLPHNVNGLIGVMNGYASDLQLGLPWQMVELHEPMRMHLLLIARLSIVQKLLEKDSYFSLLVKNRWFELSVDDFDTGFLYRYDRGSFCVFDDPTLSPKYFSVDRIVFNTRQHLPFGEIVK